MLQIVNDLNLWSSKAEISTHPASGCQAGLSFQSRVGLSSLSGIGTPSCGKALAQCSSENADMPLGQLGKKDLK